MDDKKKIVLGSEDFLAKGIDDIFININLQSTFRQVKRDKFDNDFDLAEQFRKERNESRSFRIYGIIDSTIIDCHELPIRVYANSGLTTQVYTTVSTPLGPGDFNAYGKQDGKYIIELNSYEISDDIWIKIAGNGITTADQVVKQTLVFYDADGEFVEYGTETIDIGINGSIVTIENDFPFFYNKHWIKNNIQIEEVKVRNVGFQKSSYTVFEGNSTEVVVQLSEPSVFGNESVIVNLTTPIFETYDTAAPGIDFTTPGTSFSVTLNWSAGEKDKVIDVNALLDSSVEKSFESFSLSLTNNINVSIFGGVVNIANTSVNIVDQTPKKYVNYVFQKMIRNYTPVIMPTIQQPSLSFVFPGIELNAFGTAPTGSFLERENNFRFYPNDTFKLEIINRGDSTIIPIIPGITLNEQFIGENQSIFIDIINKYQNHDSLPLEKAVFEFKYISGGIGFMSPTYSDKFLINGLESQPIQLAANEFKAAVSVMFENKGIDKVFNVSQFGRDVTLVANHPANSINGFVPKKGSGFSADYALRGLNNELPDYPDGRIQTITPQIPTELKLYANSNGATKCKYEFKIHKRGYKSVAIPSQSINATSSGVNTYLVTPIRDVIGPQLLPSDPLVCGSSSNTFDIEGYYLNGVALIAGGVIGFDDPQTKNEKIPAFSPQFRTNPLTADLINCNNLIDLSRTLS